MELTTTIIGVVDEVKCKREGMRKVLSGLELLSPEAVRLVISLVEW